MTPGLAGRWGSDHQRVDPVPPQRWLPRTRRGVNWHEGHETRVNFNSSPNHNSNLNPDGRELTLTLDVPQAEMNLFRIFQGRLHLHGISAGSRDDFEVPLGLGLRLRLRLWLRLL